MKRREFIALLGGAAAGWPVAASAQWSGKLWRVGFLAGGSQPVALESSAYAGFNLGMRELGYREGIDFVIEWRFAEGRFALFPQLAAELVRANVDVIVLGTGAAVRPTQRATSTIPIVMGYSVDPVADGYVASLARPGGNTTGLSAEETTPKRLDMAAALVPGLRRLGIFVNPDNPSYAIVLNAARAAAKQGGLDLAPVQAKNPDEVTRAFDTLIEASGSRHGQAQGLRGFEVDHQKKSGGLFDRQLGWLRSFEDLVHIACRAAVKLADAFAVAHQSAGCHIIAIGEDRWQPFLN
jgi:putative ABC transport system substrate-binding protein